LFAKIGLEGIDSDFATLVRAIVILCVLTAFVLYAGKWSNPFDLRPRSLLFVVLSGLATGASWVCYFRALKIGDASKVAPIDKLSVVLVALFAVIFLGERPVACGGSPDAMRSLTALTMRTAAATGKTSVNNPETRWSRF
jgi:transporter family protein